MRTLVMISISCALLVGCTAMQKQWEAQQAAQAQAQAAAQPANMEQLCKPSVDAYCQRCSIDAQTCGQVYISCLGAASPSDASAYNQGQVGQCVTDVQAGDCNVMPKVWPASCVAQTAPAAPDQPVETQVADNTDPAPAVDPAPPAEVHPSGKRCRAAMLRKGYAPDQIAACEGVNDRCALALLGRGYGPDMLFNCRGVEGSCAEQVLGKGWAPDQLANCRR